MKRHCDCLSSEMMFIKLPEESKHDYRTVCSTCRTFVKWGTQADLDFLEAEFGNISVEPYRGEGAGEAIDTLYRGKFADNSV